jgi:hypothetical protein
VDQPIQQHSTKTILRRGSTDVPSLPQPLRSAAQAALGVRATLVFVVLLALVFTGTNIFRYPHYESDEGTYIGSAWAMWQHGALSYYTYTYDHPPFGWFVLGLWSTITGGFHAFGMSINSGRVLMLIVAAISTALLYGCVHKVSRSTLAATVAAVVFAVSPLGVSLHRQIWLDNMATMWLLGSLLAGCGTSSGARCCSGWRSGPRKCSWCFYPRCCLSSTDKFMCYNAVSPSYYGVASRCR